VVELDFRHLVQTHKTKVYNTCLGFVHKREDAEDLSQEVFVEAYRNWSQFRQESSASTWLYRIAVNKSLSFIRANKTLKRRGETVDMDSIQITNYENPGVLLENKEETNILMSHIRLLPEHQQTAFVLHKIEGLSYEEIGSIMKKTVSAIESLLHRAKKQLQKTLNSYYVQSTK
jgi:RNA polymerase sigma factor (sigma-70 family)